MRYYFRAIYNGDWPWSGCCNFIPNAEGSSGSAVLLTLVANNHAKEHIKPKIGQLLIGWSSMRERKKFWKKGMGYTIQLWCRVTQWCYLFIPRHNKNIWHSLWVKNSDKCYRGLEIRACLNCNLKQWSLYFKNNFSPINYWVVLFHTLNPNLVQLTIYDSNKFGWYKFHFASTKKWNEGSINTSTWISIVSM